MKTFFFHRKPVALAVIALAGITAGCAFVEPQPPRHPGPYNQPVDAFDATDMPNDPMQSNTGPQRNQLGNQLQQLHNAREAFDKDQARQAAELRREQAACRANPNAKTVKIQDGTDDPEAVYCQR